MKRELFQPEIMFAISHPFVGIQLGPRDNYIGRNFVKKHEKLKNSISLISRNDHLRI